jgi:hypothetical protein
VLTNGAALLFARPHDVTIVPTMGEHRLKASSSASTASVPPGASSSRFEVDALRSQQLRFGQPDGLRPDQYRLFLAGN